MELPDANKFSAADEPENREKANWMQARCQLRCCRVKSMYIVKLSRVREEEALAPLSAPVFRPAGTHSSISSSFASPHSDFLID
jgi:hypothetical protein